VKTLDPTSLILAKAIMGKGSGRRPTDEEKYQNNWEAIFNNKEQQKDKQDELPKETTDPDQ
jgi:hypothetical protein